MTVQLTVPLTEHLTAEELSLLLAESAKKQKPVEMVIAEVLSAKASEWRAERDMQPAA